MHNHILPAHIYRIISLGSQRYILTNQEPQGEARLPVNDTSWARYYLVSRIKFVLIADRMRVIWHMLSLKQ
jgi:hypothetical protein